MQISEFPSLPDLVDPTTHCVSGSSDIPDQSCVRDSSFGVNQMLGNNGEQGTS